MPGDRDAARGRAEWPPAPCRWRTPAPGPLRPGRRGSRRSGRGPRREHRRSCRRNAPRCPRPRDHLTSRGRHCPPCQGTSKRLTTARPRRGRTTRRGPPPRPGRRWGSTAGSCDVGALAVPRPGRLGMTSAWSGSIGSQELAGCGTGVRVEREGRHDLGSGPRAATAARGTIPSRWRPRPLAGRSGAGLRCGTPPRCRRVLRWCRAPRWRWRPRADRSVRCLRRGQGPGRR